MYIVNAMNLGDVIFSKKVKLTTYVRSQRNIITVTTHKPLPINDA